MTDTDPRREAEKCEWCDGTGTDGYVEYHLRPCAMCGGSGVLRREGS